ncbi:MAG TPA: hypothetical protein VGG57_13810 [Stellaceae bacterium]
MARLDHQSVGIRPQDLPYAPSPRHFAAVNERLAAIDKKLAARLGDLRARISGLSPGQVLTAIAMVEREIDRARRTWGLFFEVFSQRGSSFAPTLAAHDVIADDCYSAVIPAVSRLYPGPQLRPLTYMEQGFSPVTWRRGVQLSRLLGETNPFPLIRIPWDRDNLWQGVFLHECSHNLQADLGIWGENRQAVVSRILRDSRDAGMARIYGRWHKEIFADLTALLLGGPAAAWGLAIFLSHPRQRVMTYRPGGAHPTGYFRVLILAEMLRRMGFGRDAAQLAKVWHTLYRVTPADRLPPALLANAPKMARSIVDEIAFQTRRNLGQHALSDVIPFRFADEQRIKEASRQLGEGRLPSAELPPRHLVSAATYAMTREGGSPHTLSRQVVTHLAELHGAPASHHTAARLALAA